MRHKFFFGGQPIVKQYRAEDFSRNGYEGKVLLQTERGIPVIVARNTDLDIWKCSGVCPLCSSVQRQKLWPTAKGGFSMQAERRCDP